LLHARRRRVRLLLLVALAALLLPSAAQAHRLTTVAVDYRVRVLSPGEPGVQANATDGGRRLQLTVQPPLTATVLGYEHEPFLRFTAGGIEARQNSPTALATGSAEGGRGWARVSTGHTFAWADQRLVPPAGAGRARWSVPLILGGRCVSVLGESWRVPRPAGWPWLGAGVAVLAAAGILLLRSGRASVGVFLAALASAAASASLIGLALAGIGSPVSRWFQAAAVAAIGVSGVGFAVCRRGAAPIALGLVAIVAAAEGIAQLGIFRHAVVLSALPADAARVAVMLAIAAGVPLIGFSVFAEAK
jgi:hypothetical protein